MAQDLDKITCSAAAKMQFKKEVKKITKKGRQVQVRILLRSGERKHLLKLVILRRVSKKLMKNSVLFCLILLPMGKFRRKY